LEVAVIEDEILAIFRDVEDDGRRFNALCDEFRRGRSVTELVPLLSSGNVDVVSTAAWIFSEIAVELYNTEEILEALRRSTEHVDPLVRSYALGALFPFLSAADPSTQALLSRLRADENKGVRERANAATARLTSK
jgi:hypothetical protein